MRGPATEDRLARLGRIVRERRLALGLTQDDVAANGGPSDRRQTQIEKGRPPVPKVQTLAKVDRVLRWAPGSAAAVLNGGDPIPDDERTYTREDVERVLKLENALSRAGVKRIAARDHSAIGGRGVELSDEVVDQLIEVLNSIPSDEGQQ